MLSENDLNKDLYQILGVNEDASADEIKKAYKSLAKKWHPDLHQDDKQIAEEKFKEINAAYDILKDEKKRQEYDMLHNHSSPNMNWDDTFNIHFDMNDIFSNIFGRQHMVQIIPISITLEDVVTGKREIPISIPTKHKCNACNGKGKISSKLKCITCDGLGFTISKENFHIDIPPGIQDGFLIPINKEYSAEIHVLKHPAFTRVNNDLYTTLTITFLQALLGDTVTIPTLTSKIDLKIPPCVQQHQKLKVSGKGILGNNLFVVINILLPDNLTLEQQKQLKELHIKDTQYNSSLHTMNAI